MSKSLSGTYNLMWLSTMQNVSPENTISDTLQSGVSTGFPKLSGSLTNGTGANAANKEYRAQLTLADGTDTDVDLSALADPFGATQSFSLVKWLLIRFVEPATGEYILLSADVTNGWTALLNGGDTDMIPVKDTLLLVDQIDGYVVDGSHKIFRLTNPGANDIVIDLVIIGE